MAKKMTQKDFYKEIIALAEANDREDIKEFAEGRIEVLDKKSANRKPTAKQEENESYKATILTILSDKGMTPSQVIKAHDDFADFSTQKMTALLRQLENEGKAVKTYDKKKALYTLV